MFYSIERINRLAKRLALLANDNVNLLASAVVNGSGRAPEVTGVVMGVMPHLIEKAIITNPSLPGDVSLRVASQFVREFELLMKSVCNAGGFSNPIKKMLFNASFHTMFFQEYEELRPKIDKVWEIAREQQANPIEYLAYSLIKRCESSGLSLDNDSNHTASCAAIGELFAAVHGMVKRA